MTDPFIIETFTSNDFLYVIDQDRSVSIVATSDYLNSVTITPQSLVTGELTFYKFEINTRNTIPQGGGLIVSFPSQIYISDTTQKCVSYMGLDNSFSCFLTLNSITITNGFLSGDFKTGVISFGLNSIKNPKTTEMTESFRVYSTYNSLVIDSLEIGIKIQMIYPNNLRVSITPDSFVVSDTTSYNFAITPFNQMPVNTRVRIKPPSDIIFKEPILCESTGILSFSVSCVVSEDYIIADLIFSSPSSSIFSVKVSKVKNPSSTKPTDSFMIYTISGEYMIDFVDVGAIVQMTTPANLKSAQITPIDSGISITTTYKLIIELNNPVSDYDYFEIQIPPQITMTSNTKCKYLSIYISCQAKGNNILQVFIFIYQSTGTIEFSIENLKNHQFTSTSSSFLISTKTMDGYMMEFMRGNVILFTCYEPCKECFNYPTVCTSCIKTSESPYLYDDNCHSSCKTG